MDFGMPQRDECDILIVFCVARSMGAVRGLGGGKLKGKRFEDIVAMNNLPGANNFRFS